MLVEHYRKVGLPKITRVSNVNKCAVHSYNENEGSPVELKLKRGKEEPPIVDQYAYFGVEISNNCVGRTHEPSNSKG